jgi:hypothetical protein
MADTSMTLLAVLRKNLLASATATGTASDASISEPFADYYKDWNYGLRGTETATKVKLVFQNTGDEADLAKTINYPARVVDMFRNDYTAFNFESIEAIGSFVQQVPYLTLSAGVHAPGFVGKYDIKDPEESREALIQLYAQTNVENLNSDYVKHVRNLYRADAEKVYNSGKNNKKSDGKLLTLEESVTLQSAYVTVVLRLWLAYQYIDYVPIGTTNQKYDSFLETQVRQLTKVVFVANLLRAAYDYATDNGNGSFLK